MASVGACLLLARLHCSPCAGTHKHAFAVRVRTQDHSGCIDLKEFTRALTHLFPTAQKADIHELFEEFDADGGGMISYGEVRAG